MRSPEPSGCSTVTRASRSREPRLRRGASEVPTIAIVGGGFSGIMVASNLLRAAAAPGGRPAHVLLIERSPGFEAGAAYRTDSPRHLLNVPAGRMSALPDDPEHFLRWLRERDPRIEAGAYVPRGLYRSYLRATLDASCDLAAGCATFEWLEAEAVDLERTARGGYVVHLDAAGPRHADAVVLAIGNLPPAHPSVAARGLEESPFYVRDPWRGSALDVEADDPVVLIGTGLTMLDCALALDEAGHRGTIIAVSRRGLLPQSQLESAACDPRPEAERRAIVDTLMRSARLDRQRTARGLLRAVRLVVAGAAVRGVDWRDVILCLRHRVEALWQRCPATERARFLRHLRPYWEVVRHRAAPAAAARFAALRDSGRLVVHAAQLRDVLEDDWGASVILRTRGNGARTVVRAAKIVNCTGPETRIERADNALLRALVVRGLVRPDPLGLGVATAEDATAIGGDGSASPGLVVVGALNRGRLWETTAVDELRVQARDAAALLATVAVTAPAVRARAAVAA